MSAGLNFLRVNAIEARKHFEKQTDLFLRNKLHPKRKPLTSYRTARFDGLKVALLQKRFSRIAGVWSEDFHELLAFDV